MAEFETGTTCRGTESRRGADPGAWLFLVLMILITSTTATAAKYAVHELPIGLMPLVRFGVAGLCLLPVAWQGGALVRLFREDFGRLVIAAALCVPINQTFFLPGGRLGPAAAAHPVHPPG